MIQTLTFIAIAAVATMITRGRPTAAIAVYMCGWLLLPETASVLLTGIPFIGGAVPTIHPATIWIILAGAWRLLLGPASPGIDARTGRIPALPFLALGTFLAGTLATTLLTQGVNGLGLFADVFLGPVTALALGVETLRRHPSTSARFRDLLIGLVAANATLALLQYLTGSLLFFTPFFARYQYWFTSTSISRASGFTDHPLVLAGLTVAGIALAADIKRPALRLGYLFLTIAGLLASGSRSGIALGAVGLLSVVLLQRSSILQRASATIAILGGAVVLLASPLGQALLARFGNSDASNSVRATAYGSVGQLVLDHLLIGGGLGFSGQQAARIGLVSFENGYLMLALDSGLALTALYVVAMGSLTIPGLASTSTRSAAVAAVLLFVDQLTFTSIGTRSAMNAILVTLVLLAIDASPRCARSYPAVPVAAPVRAHADVMASTDRTTPSPTSARVIRRTSQARS